MASHDRLEGREASTSSSSSLPRKSNLRRSIPSVSLLPLINSSSNSPLSIPFPIPTPAKVSAILRGRGRAVVPAEIFLGDRDHSRSLGSIDKNEDEDDDRRSPLANVIKNQCASPLGVPPTISSCTTSSSSFHQKPRAVKRRIDLSSHVWSPPGTRRVYQVACVEISIDRKLSRRIANGEYQDCPHWKEDETRRWPSGFGREGMVEGGEPEEVGGVAGDTDRRERGWLKRPEKEVEYQEERIERDATPVCLVTNDRSDQTIKLSKTCHQCRRNQPEKSKMRCRQGDPTCCAAYCEACCKRYSYFSFDPNSGSFACPRCKGCCSCIMCTRKRGRMHLPEPSRNGVKAKSFQREAQNHDSERVKVDARLDKAIENPEEPPFDRVRLVDHETDIISLEALEEVIHVSERVKKRETIGPSGSKKQPRTKDGNAKKRSTSITLKFKVPKKVESAAPPCKLKEVDSDGDTVGGWSDEEEVTSCTSNHSSINFDRMPVLHPPLLIPEHFPFPSRSPMLYQPMSNGYLEPNPESFMSPPQLYRHQTDSMYPTLPIPADPTMSPQAYGLLTPMSTQASWHPSPTQMYPAHAATTRKRKPPPKSGIIRMPKRNQSISARSPDLSLPYVSIKDSSNSQLNYEGFGHQPESLHDCYDHNQYNSTYSSSGSNPYPSPPSPDAVTPQLYSPSLEIIESTYLQFDSPFNSPSSLSRYESRLTPNSVSNKAPAWSHNLDLLSNVAAESRHTAAAEQYQGYLGGMSKGLFPPQGFEREQGDMTAGNGLIWLA